MFKEYDVSSSKIRVDVYDNHTLEHYMGKGTVRKIRIIENGELAIYTIDMDDGNYINRAGLTVLMSKNEAKILRDVETKGD